MKKIIISSGKWLFVALLLSLVLSAGFELITGPHLECGVNDSVGPCNYIARVIWFFSALGIYVVLIWVVVLSFVLIAHIVIGIVQRVRKREEKKR